MNTFHSISRRVLVLLLTFSLLLSCAVPALAEAENVVPNESEASAQVQTVEAAKPAAEPAAKPAAEPAAKPAAEKAAEPVIEKAPETAAEAAPEKAPETVTETASETVTETVEEKAPETVTESAEENVSEKTEEPAEEAPAEEAPAEEAAEAESEAAEETEEEAEALYFWVDPITDQMYSNLTYEECLAVIGAWIRNNPDKVLTNAAPTLMGKAAPVPGFTLKEEAAKEETPAETEKAEADEKKEEESYDVEFKLNGKEAKFSGSDTVTLEQLLKALDIEVPEGAEISLDTDSVDAEYLTWEEKDGEMVLSFKGAFNVAKSLVVYIDGVPTEIGVADAMSAEAAKKVLEKHRPSKTVEITKESYKINSSTTGKEVVIDLDGKTLVSHDTDDGYAMVIGSEDPEEKIVVTIMNGVIEAAENAVKVVGNSIVNFVNMTINAAKNVLNIGSGNPENVSTKVTVDEDTVLTSEGKHGADTVVIKDANRKNPKSGASNTLVVEGTVVNEGRGYTIGTGLSHGRDKKISNAERVKGYLNVILKSAANIVGSDNRAVFDPRLVTAHGKSTVFSMGANISSDKNIDDFGQTVFDLNYDTDNRLFTISWGKYASSDLSDVATPSRPGMSFVGWNTAADGSGTYYSAKEILEKRIEYVYAIWGPVDYHWLIAATAKYDGYETYAATRMKITDGVATVTFDAGNRKVDIEKVAIKDLKNLKNRKIKTLRICLSDDLAVEFDMDTLMDCVGIDAKGNPYNTADIYNVEDILTVVAGKTALYNLETSGLQADTKNAVVASYAADGLNVLYGKDKMFHVNAANMGGNVVLVLKNNKLVSQKVDGLDVSKFDDTRTALDKAVTSGSAVAEAAKLK